jgi:hypothetical protein
MHHVFVNGSAVVADGTLVPAALEARPGRVLSPTLRS